MSSSKRIYQIDLFRFLAAFAVVLFHYMFIGNAAGVSKVNFNQVGDYFKYGYLGVDLFFIISGFVIALSVKHNSLIKFVISRVTRLYPVYWIAVILTFVMILLFGAPQFSAGVKQFVLNLTMFQNYLGVVSIDGVYWSLFVEMKFYIFIIGAYLILKKILDIKLDTLIYCWLLLSILYLVFSDVFVFKVLNFFLILYWSSYFMAGMVFYQIFTRGLKTKDIFVLSTCLFISLYHGVHKIGDMEKYYHTEFSPYVVSSLIIAFYAFMYLVSIGKLKGINSPKLMKLGMLTYPLYLIHQIIGYILFNKLHSFVNKYVLLGMIVLLMFFLSYLISEFYEPKVSAIIKTKLEKIALRIKGGRN